MILTKENVDFVNTDELLDAEIKAGMFNKFLLCVPTNRKLRHLKKAIISSSPGQKANKINIETLGTLSKKLLQVSKQFHELSEQAATIFIEQSVKETKLIYFNNYNGNIPFGTLERIKNVISKYKETGITHELLLKEAETLERSEKSKAIDIANIYRIYSAKCNSLNAFETGDVYSNLVTTESNIFEKNFRVLFPDVKLIVFDGFDEFTQPELQILNKLSQITNTKLFLNFDYYSFNPLLFSHLDNTYKKLEEYGFKIIEEKREVNPATFIEAVKKKLFLKTKESRETTFENKITEISAPSREKEVVAIAKEIKSLLTEGKAEPHEISVTFNLIKNYSPIVRNVFHLYGIPFNLTDRPRLNQSLSVLAVINFLEILDSDYYYKNIIRAFSNSFISSDFFDMDSLLFSAVKLKIVIGKKNWEYQLNRGIAYEKKLSGLSGNSKRIAKYKRTLNTLENINDLLSPFKKELTPQMFYLELNELTHKLNIPTNILHSETTGKEREIKALTIFLDSAKEILNLIAQEYSENKTFPFKFYLEKLQTLITSTRFNVKERSEYGVLITNINELRGLNFKYSFIGGMIDGDFPTRYRPEIFFSGSFMKKENDHLNEERFRFYQALSSWEKGLFISYPTGEEFTPSTFLNDFKKGFKIKTKTFDDYYNLIYSLEEGEKQIPLTDKNFPVKEEKELWQKQSMQNLYRTETPHANSEFSGYVGSTFKTKDEKPFSVSRLETYTQCPFKYFIEHILKIETFDEPDEEIEAIEIGSLLHSIVYKFFTEISLKNIKLQNCSDHVFSIAENIMFTIAAEEVEKIFNNSPFAFYEREQILGIDNNHKHSILYKILEYERNNENELTPKYFEVNFGITDIERDEILSQKAPLLLDNIKLQGKIDRIDVDNKNKVFEIIDYKSGSKYVTKAEIEKGLSLQLPVYVWAAKTLLLNAETVKYNPVAMTIYSLKYKKDTFGKKPVFLTRKKNADFTALINELVETALTHVKNSVAGIREGKFSVTRFLNDTDNICKFCSFNSICRIESLEK
jgi:ATP-dependent helicase/nuclease subunit B